MENLLQRIDGIFKPESILRLVFERSVFLKNFKKKIFLILFLLKRSFQGIFSRFKILIGSA